MELFQVELIWNREFNFVSWGEPHENLDLAIKAAREAENMGDGGRVKETRIVDLYSGEVVWQYGKKVAKV